jgi:hypothetical protein
MRANVGGRAEHTARRRAGSDVACGVGGAVRLEPCRQFARGAAVIFPAILSHSPSREQQKRIAG